jgi:putative hydrolase of the HAD superfamily
MTDRLIIMDVGDVLITTAPMAHYRALARRVAAPWRHVQAAIEGTGVIAGFESGIVTPTEFTEVVRRALAEPGLRHHEILDAWAAVLGPLDPITTEAAAKAAAVGRLLLASNTNPAHWPLIETRLRLAGIDTPACLSYRVGHAKPGADFFRRLDGFVPLGTRAAVFIDDRPDNVAAAVRHGLAGWQHTNSVRTAEHITSLLT